MQIQNQLTESQVQMLKSSGEDMATNCLIENALLDADDIERLRLLSIDL